MIAWAVRFGKGLTALFLEYPRAIQYAAHSHGVLIELHDDPEPEVKPEPEKPDEPE